MEERWYVIRTKPRSEILAANELSQDNIEVFSPLVMTPNTSNRPVAGPLFPGYILIRLDADSGYWPTFGFGHHALGFVKFDGEVPWLPDEIVTELKKRCDEFNQDGGIWKRYQPGDWVQVISNTIQGLAQVVEDRKSAQTPVRVLLHLFERSIPLQVPRGDLQALDETSENMNHAPRRTRGRGRWTKGFGSRVPATA